jgi:phage terminase small subunit
MKKPTESKGKKGPKRAASPRARNYVKGVVEGKSKRQAAKDAGYSDTVASHPRRKLDKQPGIQALFQDILVKAGATDELLARRMYEGLNATVLVRETKYARREVLIDFKERREMAALVGKVKGVVVDKVEHEAGPTLAELLEESFQK